MLTRRHLIALSTALAFAPGLLVAQPRAETPKADYPHKPVRLVVPVAAGGPTDIVARMLADKLSRMWGQQVFIENKGSRILRQSRLLPSLPISCSCRTPRRPIPSRS